MFSFCSYSIDYLTEYFFVFSEYILIIFQVSICSVFYDLEVNRMRTEIKSRESCTFVSIMYL